MQLLLQLNTSCCTPNHPAAGVHAGRSISAQQQQLLQGGAAWPRGYNTAAAAAAAAAGAACVCSSKWQQLLQAYSLPLLLLGNMPECQLRIVWRTADAKQLLVMLLLMLQHLNALCSSKHCVCCIGSRAAAAAAAGGTFPAANGAACECCSHPVQPYCCCSRGCQQLTCSRKHVRKLSSNTADASMYVMQVNRGARAAAAAAAAVLLLLLHSRSLHNTRMQIRFEPIYLFNS
jgi:hypothetical protein